MLVATLHGPNYWAPNHDEDSIELFPDLAAAIEALFERYAANGHSTCHVEYLSGKTEDVIFPVFSEGHYFIVHELTCSNDRPLTEESIVDALGMVHGGVFDWTLILDVTDTGDVHVKVMQG